ncbi:MAG: hypothetical protein JJE13_12095 [Thermoleophilia bacterium]|nr:hypothetical protein [Thermoleophilia bacterium]
MSEKRDKGFQGGLFWVFVLCAAAAAALYFVVRPAELSTNLQVVDAVKALSAASVAIFIGTANQVSNILPARRGAFRPVVWGVLLALSLAAAIAIPVVILAFGYFSVKALILLMALLVFELLLFIVLVVARIDQLAEVAYAAPAAPAATEVRAAPPVPLAPAEEVAQYEAATLALEQATREHEEAAMEADELAKQYEARL